MNNLAKIDRVVVWFSCGAASACAAKLALDEFASRYPVQIVNCDTLGDEHEDNPRFFADCQRWFGRRIEQIKSTEFTNVDDVIDATHYMSGVRGARCTVELKKTPRIRYQRPGDLHIFGYTVEEGKRIVRFIDKNPYLRTYWILPAWAMTHKACLRMLTEAEIALPAMYLLGFKNNNCKGCLKAKSVAYWQAIRHHFPEVFEKRCQQGRELGWKPLEIKRKRLPLDQLPILNNAPLPEISEDLSCGPYCESDLDRFIAGSQQAAPPRRGEREEQEGKS